MKTPRPSDENLLKSEKALDSGRAVNYLPLVASTSYRGHPMENRDILQAHAANTHKITPAMIGDLLEKVNGTTFASFVSVTNPLLAAKNKHRLVQKVGRNNVQLFNNVDSYRIYMDAVKRSAAKNEENNPENIEAFQTQESWHEHTEVFSVVKHKQHDKYYLYAIFNSASSAFFIDGEPATREQVAELMTPSEAKKLLNPTDEVHNKTYNVKHNTTVRTFDLANIVMIKAMKQTVETV
jgi:hypothetical protein